MVGSDGYVYEGRGWHWVGAHTRGHNSRGFGVAFVGNYTGSLPSEAALNTVREVLPSCAMRAGFLQPDYKLLGHRQLVHSDCPGNALFDLLSTWPHFTTVSLPLHVPELNLSPLNLRSMNQVHPSVALHGILCPVCSDHTTSAMALPQLSFAYLLTPPLAPLYITSARPSSCPAPSPETRSHPPKGSLKLSSSPLPPYSCRQAQSF